MRVEGVDVVTVPTRAPDRSRARQRDVVGLPVEARNPDEPTAGQVRLACWHPEADGLELSPNLGGIALRVEDVQAACAEPEGRGVDVAGIRDSGVCHPGVVRDPDGNRVILHRRYAADA